MGKYVVALLDVFEAEVLGQISGELPAELELRAARSYDAAEQLDLATGADFILAGWAPVPASLIAAAPDLKLIQKWGIGYEKIDLKAAAERGVPVAITAGANAVPVAEHALMLMLAVYRRVVRFDRALREGRWLKTEARSLCFQLDGKTVGLIGCGHIGREVAKRVRAFGARVIYFDARRLSAEDEARLGVEYRPFDEVLSQADVVSLHVPLNAATRGLIGARALGLMKPTAVLINTCRGGVVDEPALAEALSAGRILGAGLDVYATEPVPPDNPLLRLENVIVTPHSAGGVFDNVARMARHAFGNMLKVARGEPLSPEDVVRG